MAEPLKSKFVLVISLIAKLLILLCAAIFVLYHSREFFGIASTGSFFDRILLVPPLAFILRASIVFFLAIAFGFLMMILFREIEGFKVGSWEVQFSKKISEDALNNLTAKNAKLEQENSELKKTFKELKSEKDALMKNLNRVLRMRGEHNK
jgi:cell division protein FtsB